MQWTGENLLAKRNTRGMTSTPPRSTGSKATPYPVRLNRLITCDSIICVDLFCHPVGISLLTMSSRMIHLCLGPVDPARKRVESAIKTD